VKLRRQAIVYSEVDSGILRSPPAPKCRPESVKSPWHSSFIDGLIFFRGYESGLRNFRNVGPGSTISDANLLSAAVQWPPSRAKDQAAMID
jgi:hypothetical protein